MRPLPRRTIRDVAFGGSILAFLVVGFCVAEETSNVDRQSVEMNDAATLSR